MSAAFAAMRSRYPGRIGPGDSRRRDRRRRPRQGQHRLHGLQGRDDSSQRRSTPSRVARSRSRDAASDRGHSRSRPRSTRSRARARCRAPGAHQGVPDQAAASAQQELAVASRTRSSATRPMSSQQISAKLGPIYQSVDAAPRRERDGRSGATLWLHGTALDVTNDVLAALNAAAAERQRRPLPQQPQQQPQGR